VAAEGSLRDLFEIDESLSAPRQGRSARGRAMGKLVMTVAF
jgi:hypothetical protein